MERSTDLATELIQWGRQGRSAQQLDDEVLAFARRRKKHHYATRPGYHWGCSKPGQRARIKQAVIYLRRKYKLSFNVIARTVPACLRTVHSIINGVVEPIPRRVRRRLGKWKYKIVNDKGTVLNLFSGAGNVKTRVLSFILGFFDSIQEAIEGKPP